jgi:mRNA-degrading endonuclease toxin of MazEF toxin-antitoxin module
VRRYDVGVESGVVLVGLGGAEGDNGRPLHALSHDPCNETASRTGVATTAGETLRPAAVASEERIGLSRHERH